MKTRHIIIFILLIAIASGIYAASLSNQFVYDDRYTVADNVYIKGLKSLPLLFKTTLMHFQYGNSGQGMFYRPIQSITYMLDYLLWGLDTTGYHITNILWHSIAAFLLYLLTMLLFRNFAVSVLAAILFIVHPVHTEAVMYISGRADSIVSAFILIYLIYFLKDIGRAGKTAVLSKEFLFAQCALLAAFLSKEIALISLPLLLLVFYVYRRDSGTAQNNKKILYRYAAAYFVILFIYYRLRSMAIESVLPSADIGFTTRLLTGITAIPQYFRLLVLPVSLHMERSIDPVQSFLHPNFLFSCIFVGALVLLAVRYGRRSAIVIFSAGWFAITLIPHLNIFIPMNAEIAEHWLYLPSMGAALLLSYIAVTGYKNTKNRFYRYVIVSVVCAVCIGCAILTVRQTGYWRDERTFCEKTIAYSPDAVKIYTNLSNVYFKSGEFEKAVGTTKQAIALRPKEYKRYSNLAMIYMGMGEYVQAEEMMMKAITLEPRSGILYSNLGTICMKQGKIKEAEQAYRTAVQIEPGFYQSYYNLGVILYESGRANEAKECFNKVEAIYPGYEQTRHYLGK